MKSTGEVMGTADTFGKAYDKAQDSVGKPIPESGTAVIDLSADEFPGPDSDAGEALVEGFTQYYDLCEAVDLVDAVKRGEVDLIISRDRDLLETAVEEAVTYFSTTASAKAALEARKQQDDPIDVRPVTDRPQRQEYWGQPKR